MENNENNTMPVPKIKHDWYQTETFVTVTILAKNSKDVKVLFGERTLSVSAKLPSGSDYSLELDLPHNIVPDECSYTVKPSKIEINLKKQESYKWDTLESSSTEQKTVQPIPREILQADSQPPQYPSCSKKSKDWDKVEKEIEKEEAEEEPEGEAALRALLVKIYNQGSDQVKRAMIKSFTESGGTVLSTDWSEVGKKPVERKPPAGMDWKPWNN